MPTTHMEQKPKTFLEEVATCLLQDNANDLSNLVVMFPSLRARAFFNDAISSIAQKTIWQPTYTSIDEVMERASGIKRVEQIRLLSELYKVYIKEFPGVKFDQFYHWGCVLISDFDMIDKYMVDADLLLVNISDLKQLEVDISYLTDAQKRIIQSLSDDQKRIVRSFWTNFQNGQDIDDLSKQKQRFLEIWKALPNIYRNFRETLIRKGIGYAGLIYRTAAKRIIDHEEVDIEPKRFIIAGFNALSKSEQILFKHLASRTEGAQFFWDYDSYYVNNPKIEKHEAGLFISKNLDKFPCDNRITHNNFEKKKDVLSTTACVSNISQVKHIGEILRGIPGELNKNTAIVLTDENLLIPLLHSLPEDVGDGRTLGKINVTMGYPLRNTLVYSFIDILITLQRNRKKDKCHFYHKNVTWLLSHPFITDICSSVAHDKIKEIEKKRVMMLDETLLSVAEPTDRDKPKVIKDKERAKMLFAKLFVEVNTWNELADYIVDIIDTLSSLLTDSTDNEGEELQRNAEHRYIATEAITKLANSVAMCDIELSTETFVTLLRRHLQTITIPYEGKPLDGLQVLGILETRNLDFENVIILSMTDANFPGNHTNQASIIPYNLRYAYEMPTPEQHEAMYAYYFYRLLQRAKRVHMLYCSRADEKSTGECSRYIYQLDFERGGLTKHALGVDLSIEDNYAITVEKDEKVMSALMRYTDEYKAPAHATRDKDGKEKEAPALSPTALFRYVECPLKFYFASIAKLYTRNELPDKIDALTLGNILHKTMENLYNKFGITGNKEPKERIKELKREDITRELDEVIGAALYNNSKAKEGDFSGDTQLVRNIILEYITRGVIRYDSAEERNDFIVTALEHTVTHDHKLDNGISVKLRGVADRIDTIAGGRMQIIDYKSGYKPHLEFNSIKTLFEGSADQRISNVFQTLLYSMMVSKENGVDTVPSLFYASRMISTDYSPYLKLTADGKPETITSYKMVAEEFETRLHALLESLYNPEIPFAQTCDKETCINCDYNRICKR